MDSLISLLHHTGSVALAIICWWLAHQNGQADPPGRVIAAGFSITGLMLLVVAFARATGDGLDWAIIVLKAAMIWTFLAVSYRRHKLGADE